MIDFNQEQKLRGVVCAVLSAPRNKVLVIQDMDFSDDGYVNVQVITNAGVITLNKWFVRAGAYNLSITTNPMQQTAIVHFTVLPLGKTESTF